VIYHRFPSGWKNCGDGFQVSAQVGRRLSKRLKSGDKSPHSKERLLV
jgi:hypothetical protein